MSRSRRPFTPPAELIWLKAVSTPIFIWRPSSRDAPLSGAAIPNESSLSLTPRTALSGALVCAGGVAAAFAPTTEEALATPGPGEGGPGRAAWLTAFASGDAPFETSASAGGGPPPPKRSISPRSCGRSFSQPNSFAKRAASSPEGLLRSRARRSPSRLQTSSAVSAAASVPGEGRPGRAAWLTAFASGDAPFETSGAAGAGVFSAENSLGTSALIPDAPLKGAAIRNKISLSLTPRTALSGALVCAGGVAAAFAPTTEEALATPGPGEGRPGRVASPTAFASGDAPFETSAAAGAEALSAGSSRSTFAVADCA